MIVTGLSSDLYLINAPIWIDIQNIADNCKYVNVTLTDITNPSAPVTFNTLRLHNFGNNIPDVELNEYIKGNFNEPLHPSSVLNDMDMAVNYAKFRMNFTEQLDTGAGSTITIEKTFIRGAKSSVSTNQTLQTGTTLAEMGSVLQWVGYPSARYYIGTDKKIHVQTLVADEFISNKIIRNECDSIFVRFLNRLGGYDFWLFESNKVDYKTKSLDIIKRRSNPLHLGFETSRKIALTSRIPIELTPIAEAMVVSPDFYIFNTETSKFDKVRVLDNKISYENYDSYIDVNIDIEPYTQIDYRVTI